MARISPLVGPDHPAKFSAPISERLAELLAAEAERRGRPLVVLDPFAGIGRIHRLPTAIEHATVGVELEPEWAIAGGSIPGDATALPFRSGAFDAIATSPCYGNRMADTYDGSRDTCSACSGLGAQESIPGVCFSIDGDRWHPVGGCLGCPPCPVCGGSGRSPSRRRTYRISLGRPLSEGSAAGLQWGPAYRELHKRAWQEAGRVIRPGGLLLVNISNHVRAGRLQPVVEWHLFQLLRLGFLLIEAAPIETQRMRHGQNFELRADAEHVLVLRDPRPIPEED